MPAAHTAPLILLGPQVPRPNLRQALAALQLHGPFAAISAGWQEREGELDELRAHVGAEVTDLALYARTEEVFAADVPLREAHRNRQARLQELQALYRIRLAHAKEAVRELHACAGDPALVREARRLAIDALRRLDESHLQAIRASHEQFDLALRPAARPAIRAAAGELARQIGRASAVFVAGGHVAVLVNRLRLLGVASLLAGKPLIAWSAGAMALGELVVLFHDHPPQGAGNVEVADSGLGLLRGVLPFPHASARLDLADAVRVSTIARRFAASSCVTLDPGAMLQFAGHALVAASGTRRMGLAGELLAPLP